jgi:hypothetical protein
MFYLLDMSIYSKRKEGGKEERKEGRREGRVNLLSTSCLGSAF